MANLKELREQQARLVTEARTKMDEVSGADASRAKELDVQYDKIMAEHDAIDVTIKREERLAEAEARLAERLAAGDPRRPNGENTEGRAGGNEESITYREAFRDYFRAGGQMSEMDTESRDVLRRGEVSAKELRVQTTLTGAAGGFTVPTELQAHIIKSLKAFGPMYDPGITTELKTASGAAIDMPTVDDTAGTAALHTEGAVIADTGTKDVVIGKKTLLAYVYDTEFVKFSFELAQDSLFAFETLLGDLLGERIGRLANDKLTTGASGTEPQGIVTGSSQGLLTTSASAITWDNIIDLEMSIDDAYLAGPKVRYMFSKAILKAARKLKDGQGNYLWQKGDVRLGTPDTMNGYAYTVNNSMAGFGVNNKAMVFGDFSKYYVRKVGDPAVMVAREKFMPNLGVAGLVRFDGLLGDTAAVKHMVLAAV
ncbi:MAG: phage major capsid protein [Alphaproteobacteria bacterium]|nr:MAG: phage major capsid protein [Alphaproteobacteria bacterium]